MLLLFFFVGKKPQKPEKHKRIGRFLLNLNNDRSFRFEHQRPWKEEEVEELFCFWTKKTKYNTKKKKRKYFLQNLQKQLVIVFERSIRFFTDVFFSQSTTFLHEACE